MPIQEESGGYDHQAPQGAQQNRRKTDTRKVVPYDEWTPEQKQALRDSKGIKHLNPSPDFPSARELGSAVSGRAPINTIDTGSDPGMVAQGPPPTLPQSTGNIKDESGLTDHIASLYKQTADAMPWYEKIMPQLGSGLTEAGLGAKQAIINLREKMHGTPLDILSLDPAAGASDAVRQQVNEKRGTDAPLNTGILGHLVSGIGEAAPTFLVPGGLGKKLGEGALKSAFKALGTGALRGGAQSATLGTVADGETRLGNTASGAAGGVLGTIAGKVGGKVIDAGGAAVNALLGKTIKGQLSAEYERLLANRQVPVTPEFQGDLYRASRAAQDFLPEHKPAVDRWAQGLLDKAHDQGYVVNANQFKRALDPIKTDIANTMRGHVANVAYMVPQAGEKMIKATMSPEDLIAYNRVQNLWGKMKQGNYGDSASGAARGALNMMPSNIGGVANLFGLTDLAKQGALAMAVRKQTPFEIKYNDPATRASAATAAALMPDLFR